MIYLESKFPPCVVRHVCKKLRDHLQVSYITNTFVLQSTAFTINIGRRWVAEKYLSFDWSF